MCAAVVKSRIDPRLVGCIHEADLLRCYVEEADRMRREELGGVGSHRFRRRPGGALAATPRRRPLRRENTIIGNYIW